MSQSTPAPCSCADIILTTVCTCSLSCSGVRQNEHQAGQAGQYVPAPRRESYAMAREHQRQTPERRRRANSSRCAIPRECAGPIRAEIGQIPSTNVHCICQGAVGRAHRIKFSWVDIHLVMVQDLADEQNLLPAAFLESRVVQHSALYRVLC